MEKLINAMFRAILYVLLAVGLHLILIYFLGIRMELREPGVIQTLFKMYLLPLLLGFVNCFLLIRTGGIKHQVIWFLGMMLSSFLLLFFFKVIQTSGDSEYGAIVSFELLPKYDLEMLLLFPRGVLVVQSVLTFYYLIKRKEILNRVLV
ncbi:hypothetical protein GC101_06220 [Paenibacillus sp. LMG 31459]|uniref:Uncharacterized protein n=1 Tax=Paenibacillus phytohabitans TaxID=2654978 RepID=A0ABX1YDK2_9BACL|nr:hypothetical protein [Paenibacillus phytohabitans]NOU78474.1 hypothetical protein [Paenibacillus phytohabitans]